MTGASLGEAFGAAIDALEAAGVATPRLDAEVMLEHATGFDRTRFVTEPELPMPEGSAPEFAAMVRRRIAREPVAYITAHRGFRHLLLECDPRALIPRPESELLVELALELGPRRVLDVGTGSGAVALAIADEVFGCALIATDTSAPALALARHNAHRLGLGDRIEFVEGSVAAGSFDLVVANLPYVTEADWATLEPEIREWEPREALVAGADGLDAIRAVLGEIGPPGSGAVCEASALALEIGEGQGEAVSALIESRGYPQTETLHDLARIERAIIGR